jgi:hypothetical protein
MTLGRVMAAAVVAVLMLVCTGGLWLFRYEPMTVQPNPGYVRLWDRLGGRECVTPRPGYTAVTGVACTKQEIEDLQATVEHAQLVEDEQRQTMFRIAGSNSLDHDGTWAVARLREGGFHEDEIAGYVAPLRRKMLAAAIPKRMVDKFWGGDPYAQPPETPR